MVKSYWFILVDNSHIIIKRKFNHRLSTIPTSTKWTTNSK